MADAKVSAGTQITNMPLAGKMYVDDAGVDKYVEFDNLSETGTFTPTLYGSVTAGTQTYTQQNGRYSRVGKTVRFDLYILMSAKDGTTDGDIYIGGLPYNQTSGVVYNAVSIGTTINITLTSGYFIQGYINTGTNVILLKESNGTARNSITDTEIAAATEIMISGCYQVA